MLRNAAITHKTTTKSVLDLQNLYEHGHLNLEPGFQRQSVWHDRKQRLESILMFMGSMRGANRAPAVALRRGPLDSSWRRPHL